MSETNDEFIEDLRSQLEEWNMGLEELQSRVERAEAEKQSRLNDRLRRLREDYHRSRERFTTLSESGTETWDEFREGMITARKLLDEALQEAGGEPDE
jgi:predicted nuclease with TOPRIM domain